MASAGQERQEECLPVTRIGTTSLVLPPPVSGDPSQRIRVLLSPGWGAVDCADREDVLLRPARAQSTACYLCIVFVFPAKLLSR